MYVRFRMKQGIQQGVVFCCIIAFAGLCGCAHLKEGARGVWGRSTKILEEKKAEGASERLPGTQQDLFAQAEKTLLKMGCYVYTTDAQKQLIAVYVSETDTTPVGVFVEAAGGAEAAVTVSSASRDAKEYIAKRLFALLKGLPDPDVLLAEEEEGEAGEADAAGGAVLP